MGNKTPTDDNSAISNSTVIGWHDFNWLEPGMETQQLLEAVKIIEAIKPLFGEKPNPWLPVIGPVLGTLAGGTVVFLSTYWSEIQKGRRQSRLVTLALLAEIRALLVVIESRKYLVLMEEIVDYLKENADPPVVAPN